MAQPPAGRLDPAGPMAVSTASGSEARPDVVLAVAARLLPESDIPDNSAWGADGAAQAELR
jgi:hypothetical protein